MKKIYEYNITREIKQDAELAIQLYTDNKLTEADIILKKYNATIIDAAYFLTFKYLAKFEQGLSIIIVRPHVIKGYVELVVNMGKCCKYHKRKVKTVDNGETKEMYFMFNKEKFYLEKYL